MPPVGFEPTISAVERPQTYALDRAATGTKIPSTSYIYMLRYPKTNVNFTSVEIYISVWEGRGPVAQSV